MSIFDGGRESWEEWTTLNGLALWLVAALIVVAWLLSGCASAPAPAPTSQEPGFSAFCAAHPHRGTCP